MIKSTRVGATTAPKNYHATLKSYVAGFVLSLALTIEAYVLVVRHQLSGGVLIFALVGLALTQFMVQLLFFLHLGREVRPRWRLLVFGFMVMIVMILVLGSLWIMHNLNYHMSLQQMYKYINSQGDGI